MKFILERLIVSCLLLMTNGNFAQVYRPLPMDSVCWRTIDTDEPDPTTCDYYFVNYVDGDTVINTKRYRKIFHEIEPSITTCQYISSNPYYEAAIRQDTVAKLIWYIPSGNSIEDTLYDFNQTAGQRLNGCPTQTISLVDSVLIGANYHKRISLSGNHHTIIEGIGSTAGLFHHCFQFQVDDNLLRMIYAGNTLYKDVSRSWADTVSSCGSSAATGIVLTKNKNKILYCSYNPVGDYLEITVNGVMQHSNAEMHTVGGQKIAATGNFEHKTQIDLTGISTGIYFVFVKFSDGSVENKKVIISK